MYSIYTYMKNSIGLSVIKYNLQLNIAAFPWIDIHDYQQIDLNEFKHVKRWHKEIAQRPAVKRGLLIP